MTSPLTHPRVVQLLSGRRVALRPAAPEDVAGIAVLFAGLSAESFRWRFRSQRSTTKALLQLARIDRHPATMSVVAERLSGAGIVVAEARVMPLGEDSAELEIAVADSYQSSGLGRLLLDAVLDQARHCGLHRLRAAPRPRPLLAQRHRGVRRLRQQSGRELERPRRDLRRHAAIRPAGLTVHRCR
jgi:GNAT superfamily N-acetyltransferase